MLLEAGLDAFAEQGAVGQDHGGAAAGLEEASEGYDAEEVDRRIAADHAREEELGLKFGRPATALADSAVEVEPEDRDRPMQSEENAA
jgi:capsid protein